MKFPSNNSGWTAGWMGGVTTAIVIIVLNHNYPNTPILNSVLALICGIGVNIFFD